MNPVALLVGIILLLIIGLIVWKSKKKSDREPDYHTLYVLGIIWCGAGIPLGVSMGNYSIMIMGLLFLGIGSANKKKWKPRQTVLTKEQEKTTWEFFIFGLLALIGLFLSILYIN